MFDKARLERIRERLIDNNETITVAESVTSGLMQCAFSQAKDASCFFEGGITVYQLGQKTKHLDVEPVHAEAVHMVSTKVSEQMALGALQMFCTDWAIAITGFAARTDSNSILYAYASIAFRNKIVRTDRIVSDKEDGWETQVYFTTETLRLLDDCLTEKYAAVPK
ncbi:CinA family protein [Sediminibacterium soli]|uniref:CinA family protein n=1 Tax=Sediminibacterium soli TaxID=2698829 RepID=UPI00137B4FDB|nr:CinA family protein [Sediminibacterium soli]NCI46762.1 CinA family protein [Sediminibacterium soli]